MSVRQSSVLRNWSNGKQIVVLGNLILAVAIIHTLLPFARPYTRLFYTLPYYQGEGRYLQGPDDVFFVAGSLVFLTLARAALIEGILLSIARYGHIGKKARTRLAEQSWLLVYDGLSFAGGMYIFMTSTYWLDFRELWSDWPTRQMSGSLKWYYLVQLSFWLQQLLAINLEKPRKDYRQMLTHHMITCSLMYVTYAYHWTKIGNVILCIMDVVDFLLPLAKILKYLHYENACNAAFGVFLSVWLIARHVIYVALCWSIYRDVPGVMSYGCYSGATEKLKDPDTLTSPGKYLEPFYDQDGTICLDKGVKWVFLGMLLMLQVLSIVWFGMILKVAYNILKRGAANDTRSGDEDEDEDEDEDDVEETRSQERTAPPTASAKIRGSVGESVPIRSGMFADRGGRLRIPRSRDRKDMIGRVGCNGSLE